MKTYRPHNIGYIVLYALVALSVGDAAYTMLSQAMGRANAVTQNFSMFSYLIAVLAVMYVRVYVPSRVSIGDGNIRIVFPASIKPAPDAKRAFFVYRQGELDTKLIDKTFALGTVERYGYVDDFKLSRVDQSGANEKTPLLPVKEVCFLTSEGKRYHMNAAVYNKKQLREMFTQIRDITGIEPEGSLAEVIR